MAKTAKTISLAGGDTVQVMPGAIAKVQSELFEQMPDSKCFQPVVPSKLDIATATALINEERANATENPEESGQSGSEDEGSKSLDDKSQVETKTPITPEVTPGSSEKVASTNTGLGKTPPVSGKSADPKSEPKSDETK